MSLDSEPMPQLLRPVGLTLVRASEIYGAEPYFHELIAGIDRVVRPLGLSILLRVLPTREEELAVHRRWRDDGAVTAVILVDLSDNDERVRQVRELGLPAIVIGAPSTADGLPAIWTNDALAMRDAVEFLRGLGHTHLGHVTGPAELTHTRSRIGAFDEACRQPDMTTTSMGGDYSRESGERALTAMLAQTPRPTAVVFDSDVMAIGGLDAARRAGLRVPQDLSLIAWDDSAQCQLSDPPLSAMSNDVQLIGEMAGEALLEVLRGRAPDTQEAPRPVLVQRETTAAAPAA